MKGSEVFERLMNSENTVAISATEAVRLHNFLKGMISAHNHVRKERDEALAKLAAMESQKPAAYGLKGMATQKWDGDTLISKCDAEAYDDDALVPLYAEPVPTKPAYKQIRRTELPSNTSRSHLLNEAANRADYFFRQVDGSYKFPAPDGQVSQIIEMLLAAANMPADKPAVAVPDDYIQKILFHADRCGNADWEADVRDDYCAYLCGPEMSYDECYFENSHEAVLISLVQPKSIKAIIRRLLNCESELKELRSAPSHSQQSDAVDLLRQIFELYEDGVDCYENPDEGAGYLGKAFRIDDDTYKLCVELLDSSEDRCPSHESEQGGAV